MKNTNKSETKTARRQGRKPVEFNLPNKRRGSLVTISELHEANPHIKSRLTVYRHRDMLVKKGWLRRTRKDEPNDGTRGRPGRLFEIVAKDDKTLAKIKTEGNGDRKAKTTVTKVTASLAPDQVAVPTPIPEPVTA